MYSEDYEEGDDSSAYEEGSSTGDDDTVDNDGNIFIWISMLLKNK